MYIDKPLIIDDTSVTTCLYTYSRQTHVFKPIILSSVDVVYFKSMLEVFPIK